jgi:tetratricopeptide (TPR) repeat protein
VGKRSRLKQEHPAAAVAAEPARISGDSRTAVAVSIALAVAIVAVYAQVIHHQFINFDDPEYIVSNPHVNTGLSLANVVWAFTTVYAAYWHPLTWISHMLDVSLFGLDAGKHLFVNVLLHAANTIVLFAFLRRATHRLWASATVAALFALHPLHVESVAWAAERKDVLSTLFLFLTLLFYAGYVQRDSRRDYALTILFLACGLLSKPMLVTTPFVMLLLDRWPFARARSRRLLIEKLPHFGLVAVFALMTMRTQSEAMAHLGILARLANATLSYAAYLGKMLWPAHLAAAYTFRTVMAPSAVAACALLLLAITVVALLAAKRMPYVTVGWLWYAGTLVPVSGIVQVGRQSMADRFTYVPLVGIFIAVVCLAAEFVKDRNVAAALGAIAIAACAIVTFRQVSYWHDPVTLFEHAVEVTGADNGLAHGALGLALIHEADWPRAERELRAAIAVSPADAPSHSGLGTVLIAEHRNDEAERELRAAVQLNPKDADAYRKLGTIEAERGRAAEAQSLYAQSLAVKPTGATLAIVHNDRAAALARTGHDQEALAEYQEALRLDPTHYDAHMNVAALLSRMGRDAEAIGQVKIATQLRPKTTEPHVYLALMYANAGHLDEAVAEANDALAINATSANAEFSNAIHQRDAHLQEWVAFLQSKRR